jgi:hypothetical protein
MRSLHTPLGVVFLCPEVYDSALRSCVDKQLIAGTATSLVSHILSDARPVRIDWNLALP